MNRFLGKAAALLDPYVPGEQPQDQQYVKLNTNESPYPPSPLVLEAIAEANNARLRLYPDPSIASLTKEIAIYYQLSEKQVFVGAGSDEILGYAYMAFFDQGDEICFPDISYGFYPVYAQLCGLVAKRIPLDEDFQINLADYHKESGHVVIANPNAPTGIVLAPTEIEQFLKDHPDRLLLVDEAYIDFSQGNSCVSLVEKYDNLLVVQTFSKSRSLAGMRIGCAIGNEELVKALLRIKFSFNPYNLNHLSIAAGIAAIQDQGYFAEQVERIVVTRKKTAERLKTLGFSVLPSEGNFLFARYHGKTGKELYQLLKQHGILIRHFDKPRIADFIRITIGSEIEMEQFFAVLEEIL